MPGQRKGHGCGGGNSGRGGKNVASNECSYCGKAGRKKKKDEQAHTDTGATNHMTSSRSAFFELDTGVHGTVKFGDGSVVSIKGRGTVLFNYKND